MSENTLTEFRAITEARDYAARWGNPQDVDAWRKLSIEPWQSYEQLKWELADEIDPGSDAWGPACRAIARELGI